MNSTGATATFDILYNKDFPGDFWGPDQITLDDGASADFDVILDPHLCAEDADYLATVSVSDGVYSDETTIYYEVYSELQEWQQIPTDPNLLMDNVLAGYAGKVWSITGYGASNGVTTYDPALDTWTGIPGSIAPWGVSSYPRSGCQVGNEVFIYGDAGGAYTGLWSYNMDTNTWTSETPGGTPPPYAGIWAPSWVADTSSGVCYMTGGGTAPGGGNLTTVYVYDTVANAWLPELPVFTTARDFHAAFLYTRPTDSHNLLCVAGGVSIASVVFDSTQCYDFSTAAWDPENADLGALPNACWGMGYAQREGELWLVEGADAAFALYNESAYYDIEDGEWVMAGPLPSGNVYRTAAVTLDNTVYHIGGSTGGFTPSGLSDKFVDITCPACEIPGFTKEATELAFPGQTIHYSISVDPFVKDTALVYDYLPDSVEYVPGSLSVSPDVGTYDYDSLDRMIWWYNGPGLLKGKGWTPAAKSSISSTTAITTHYDAPAEVTSSTPTDYAIEMVLWDQPLSTVNQNAYVNQEFSDFASYSSFLADDFTVTMPWMVNSIFVPGDGWNGFTTLLNASALNFMIYEDSAGIPAGDPTGGGAMPVWALSLLPTDPQVTISAGTSGYDSNVQLDLDEPLMLPTGHYWLIFYPSLSFASGGQFGRQPADTANLHTASFINPGGGFGLGPFWQPWNVLDVTQTDLAFRIEGEQVGSLLIEFDATASGLNQVIWNFAYLAYGSYLTQAGADTFTGNGIYLPMTIK